MRQIYEIGKNITMAMMAIGVLMLVVAVILAITVDVSQTTAMVCAAAGISLMLSSFSLSLLVYLGEDISNIAARIAQQDVTNNTLPGTTTPKQTASGDDPNLINLINQIEANTRDKA